MTDGRYALDCAAMHAEHVCDCLVMGERAYARTLEEPRERVVRCRDCARWRDGVCGLLEDFNRVTGPDGFCAWGETRED